MPFDLDKHPILARVVEATMVGMLGWGGFAIVGARVENAAQTHDIAALKQDTSRLEDALPRIESAVTEIRVNTGRIDERTAFLVGAVPATSPKEQPR